MFQKLLCVTAALMFSLSVQAKENVEWLFYIYLCGSDLESQGGAATTDIGEMLQANLPANSTILVCTGGANGWQNNEVNASALQIYRIDQNNEFTLLGEDEASNMGDPSTLASFLSFGEERFNAKKKGMIFWDHGGGPAGGVCYDELSEGDFLSMPEIYQAFTQVFGQKNPETFEMIGFDACLMASLETSFYMSDWGKYLVASEELEPGCGWDYTNWLSGLASNPSMSGDKLGKIIADSFLNFCRNEGLEDVTLSVVDLQKAKVAQLAYMNLGYELIEKVESSNKNVFTVIERSAQKSEKYGSEQNCESIDLMHFINNLSDVVDSSEMVSALNDAVVYKINGKYRKSNGLSVYYPVKKKQEKFEFVSQNGFISPMMMFNGALMGYNSESVQSELITAIEQNYTSIASDLSLSSDEGEVQTPSEETSEVAENEPSSAQPEQTESSGGNSFVNSALTTVNIKENVNTLVQAAAQSLSGIKKEDFSIEEALKDLPITINKDGDSFIKLPESILDNVSTVSFSFSYIEKPTKDKDGGIWFVGTDDNIKMDWDKGVFTDQFDNSWASINGHLMPLMVSEFTDDYTLYDCYIKVNGVPANMSVAYNYDKEEYSIVSVIKLNKEGIPTRKNITLKDGDQITTMMYHSSLKLDDSADDEEPEEYENETFSYDSKMKIKNEDLGDGSYLLMFEVTGLNGETAYSDGVVVETVDGEMTIYTLEDYLSDDSDE